MFGRKPQSNDGYEYLARNATLIFHHDGSRFPKALVADYQKGNDTYEVWVATAFQAERGKKYKVDIRWSKRKNYLTAILLEPSGDEQMRVRQVSTQDFEREVENGIFYYRFAADGAPVHLAPDLWPQSNRERNDGNAPVDPLDPQDPRPVYLVGTWSGVYWVTRDEAKSVTLAQTATEDEERVRWTGPIAYRWHPIILEARSVGQPIDRAVETILGLPFLANPEQIKEAVKKVQRDYRREHGIDHLQAEVGHGITKATFERIAEAVTANLHTIEKAGTAMGNRWLQQQAADAGTEALLAQMRALPEPSDSESTSPPADEKPSVTWQEVLAMTPRTEKATLHDQLSAALTEYVSASPMTIGVDDLTLGQKIFAAFSSIDLKRSEPAIAKLIAKINTVRQRSATA